jgi:hypothetical protein
VYRSVLVLRRAITFCNGGVGQHLITILNLSRSERTNNGLSNSYLLTIFWDILIDLKTLHNDEGRHHTV